MKENIKNERVEYLKNSPLFAMSLGSKELFHSNLWAWIMEQNVSFAFEFFEIPKTEERIDIVREEGNRDITVHINDKEYVIENKFKAIPTKEQLEGYDCDEGVLVALEKPMWSLPDKWSFKSYEDVISLLDGVELENKFHNEIIKEYKTVLENLVALINESCSESELLHNESCFLQEHLGKLRIWDICQKASAEKFVRYLNERNEIKNFRQNLGGEYELVICSGFTHSQVLIDLKIIGKNREKIGIQLQGGKYCKTGELATTEINGTKEATQKKLVENAWLTYLEKGWFSPEKTGKMNKLYCSYKGTTKLSKTTEECYGFVYQHTPIENYSFDFLADKIIKDLKDARVLI